MVLAGGALALVVLVLVVHSALSVLSTPADQVRHLPRAAWLLVVLALPLVGAVAWRVAGRPAPHGRPVRAQAPSPDDDEAFLRRLRERAAAQRAEAERRQARGEPGQADGSP